MTLPRPNFLVAGAQKCGTSFLCAVLAKHPSVFHSNPKEPLFFQRAGVDDAAFAKYLATHFSDAGNQPLVGEGSTVYFQWPNALENIRKYLGDELKIIISLRHPTDRAVSFYLHNVRKGRLTGTERITDVGSDVRMSPVLSSLYADHLERWIDAYGDRVQVLLFDDLLASPTRFVEQATGFLGIASVGEVTHKAVNKGYGLAWNGDRLGIAGASQADAGFTLSELEDLHALFSDDIRRTQALVGRCLPAWEVMPEFTAKHAGW